MKKIVIHYWVGELDGLNYKHGQEMEYSDDRRNEIIDFVLSKGYHVMLMTQKSTGDLWVWIDNKAFRQR